NPIAPDPGYRQVSIRPDGTRMSTPSAAVQDLVDNHLLTQPRLAPKRSASDPIREGHGEADLRNFLNGDPANGVPAQGFVQSQTPSGVPGESVIEYRLYQATPGGALTTVPQAKTGLKTVWDPNVWDRESLARHVQEV